MNPVPGKMYKLKADRTPAFAYQVNDKQKLKFYDICEDQIFMYIGSYVEDYGHLGKEIVDKILLDGEILNLGGFFEPSWLVEVC
jgi:hypothetical protein